MCANAARAVPLPPLDSSSPFAEYGLGFSQGDLFLHTGDTIHKLGQDPGGNDEWQQVITGLESAFAGGPRSFEGDFATSPVGTAAVSMGFSDRGVLRVDLNAPAAGEVPALDTANIFSLAGAPDGSFYGMNSIFEFDPGTGNFIVNNTQIVRIDPAGNVSIVVDELAPGDFSGGVAVDEQGNLYASTFVSVFPNPVGTASFWKIDAMDLAGPNPMAMLLGTGQTNGSNSLAVNAAGDVFFGSNTGIGVLPNGATQAQAFFGDLLEDVFAGPTQFTITGGLAIDPRTGELVFIDQSGGQAGALVRLPTQAAAIPEPVALPLLAMFATAVCTRRRRAVTRM